MARLVVSPGSPASWTIDLKPGDNFLGRGFTNDFVITDASVSGSHCQVVVNGPTVLIRDLGSTNGTFVNDAQVRECALQNGQTVRLGGVEMVFQADASTPPVARPVPVATPLPATPVAIAAIPPRPSPAMAAAPLPVPLPPPPIPVEAPLTATPAVRARVVVPPATPPAPAVPVARAVSSPGSATAPEPEIYLPSGPPSPPAPTAKPIVVRAVPQAAAPAAPRLSQPPPSTARIPLPPGLAAPAAAPITVSAPPPPLPTAAAAEVADGPHFCKFHPKAPARFMCGQCHQYYCDVCSPSRQVGGVPRKFCRNCGAELAPIKVQLQRAVVKGFFARVPGAFVYPVRGMGFLMIIAAMVIVSVLKFGQIAMKFGTIRMLMFGIVLEICAGGYLFTFLQAILHSTAAEDPEPPSPPFANFFDDIFVPFFKLLALFLFCFAPATALGVWVLLTHQPEFSAGHFAFWGASLFGYLYFPMAFLAMAILDSMLAANPLLVVPSILKAPLEYFTALLVFAAAVGARMLGTYLTDKFFPEGWTTHAMGEFFAMVGLMLFAGMVTMYLVLVAIHLLGLLFVVKKESLGWLQR